MATEINLGNAQELDANDPRRVQNYTGPDGMRHQVVDTRMPLDRMRRKDLAVLAIQQGFDLSSDPTKNEIIQMLELPQSVRGQMTGGRNQAQARAAVESRKKVTAEDTNVGPRALMDQLSEADVEGEKKEVMKELQTMPYFTFRSLMKKAGISVKTGEGRDEAIAAYVETL